MPSAARPGKLVHVPLRPDRTSRPRLLPGALVASAIVVAAATGVLAATGPTTEPAAETCSSGSEYVTVQPVLDEDDWKPPQKAGPTLTGCLDSEQLDKAAEHAAEPTNPRG